MRRAVELFFSASLLLAASVSAQTPAERFRAAEARWNAHRPDGTVLSDDSRAAREALAAMWQAAEDQAVATLVGKPESAPEALAAALTGMEFGSGGRPDPKELAELKKSGLRLQASPVQLAPRTFAIAFTDEVASTVFVVGPARSAPDGKPALLWSLATTSAQPTDGNGLLRAWQLARQGEACRQTPPVQGRGTNQDGACGPLTASLNKLPADGAGHPRFLVDATYSQDMGATLGKQAGIWAWEGGVAHLLWIATYAINADQKFGMRYFDNVLELGAKQQFKTFASCGACDGRQMIRTLRLTDTGVQDLGTRSTVPELDAVDDVFAALAANLPASELVSVAAARTLEPLIAAARANAAKVDPKYFSVGLLSSSSVHGQGGVAQVCLVTDELGRLDLTLEHRGGALFVAQATAAAGQVQACK